MPVTPFLNAQILVGGYDYSGHSNQVAVERSAAMLDGTVFGGGKTKRNVQGLYDWKVSVTGFWEVSNPTPTPPETDLWGDKALTDAFEGNLAGISNLGGPAYGFPCSISADRIAGTRVYFGETISPALNFFGTVGELTPFSLELCQSLKEPALIAGWIALPLVSRPLGTGSGAHTVPLPAVGGKKAFAAYHVIAKTGTPTLTITVTTTGATIPVRNVAPVTGPEAGIVRHAADIPVDVVYTANYIVGGTGTVTFAVMVGVQ